MAWSLKSILLEDILIVGLDSVALARSAHRAGYNVHAVDYFGDQDLRKICDSCESIISQQVGRSCGRLEENFSPKKFVDSARRISETHNIDGILLASGLEDSQETLLELNEIAPIIGNDLKSIEKVRNKTDFHSQVQTLGINSPKTLLARTIEEVKQAASEIDYPILLKPLHSFGGSGIALAKNKTQLVKILRRTVFDTQGMLIQESISGKQMSMSIVSTRDTVTLLSLNEQLLGVKEIVNPLELAKQRLDLEQRAMENAIDQQANIINRIGKTTLPEKIQAKVKNIPTKAVAEMRELLDTYEDAPDFLPPEKKEVFNWFRNLSRSMLKGQNAVRQNLGIEPIKYRRAYVRHIADNMARELLEGKYPFPQGLKYWSERIVGKTIHNPMAMQRQLADDLENYFTRDLIYATKSMVRTGLKEIHLSQPLRVFSAQLTALSKDYPIYKNLTLAEQNVMNESNVMPASTKGWLIDYVNQVIKGQQTWLDETTNKIVTDSGIGGVINKLLKPFGRTLGRKPITSVFSGMGRAIIHSVMGPRPRQVIRNKFQLFQNLALYTIKANLKGFMPASVNKNLEELIGKSLFFKGYTGLEEMPIDVRKKLEKIYHAPYQWSAVTNAGQAMKVAFWDTQELVINPKYRELDWADPQRSYKEPKDFLYPSEKTKILKEMEFGAAVTQYSYIPMGMPEVFRSKVLTPFTRLQSWWMRYFTQFTRESIHRVFRGETSYGAKLPWSRRLGYFRYLIIGGSILSALGYKRSFLLGVLPTYLSPAAQLALGFYVYTTSDREWEKKMAVNRMKNSWRAFIPGSGAWKDFTSVWKGEKPLKSLFLYIPYEKKEKGELDFDIDLDLGIDIEELDIEL